MINYSLKELYDCPPLVHGEGDKCWKISRSTAQFIADTVQKSWVTLETGCGLSTVLFALHSLNHTCVMPNEEEVQRIREYCSHREISVDNVTFCVEGSQQYLPKMPPQKFDLALIDGCHAFPSPFLDYYYIEPNLKVDGLLLIDDIQVWTGNVLASFLNENSHWLFEQEIAARCSVCRKSSEGCREQGWNEQPFVSRRSKLTRSSQVFDFAKRRVLYKLFSNTSR